jgi:bla regulator protein BlaR1
VIALPLTATVTYAEAVDPADPMDISVPDAPLAPAAPLAPMAPSAPAAPLAPSAPAAVGDVTNITMLNGRKNYDPADDYVHKIQHNGKTIILRTDKKLSDKQVREMVAEAEKSRIEADKALREHRSDSKHMRSTMNEVEREIAQRCRNPARRNVRLFKMPATHSGMPGKRNARPGIVPSRPLAYPLSLIPPAPRSTARIVPR